MKIKVVLGLLMLLALGFSVQAQNAKTEKFEVKGNCGMCETRMHRASDEAYAKLPACCKYERDEEKDRGKKK